MPDGRIKYTRTHGNVVHHPNAGRECVGAMQDVTSATCPIGPSTRPGRSSRA